MNPSGWDAVSVPAMLTVEIGEGYAVVTLDRPEKRNAPAIARDLCFTGRMLAPREALALETKRRVLLDAARSWLPLLEDEAQVLRRALLGDSR